MLIDIPNEEKVIIGKFIDEQRKYRFKVKKEQSFKIDSFIDSICSKQTYQKLKKAPLIESEIYDSLLKRLGFEYNYEQLGKSELIKIENSIYKSFLAFDISGVYDKLKNELVPFLENLQKYPHEYILLEALKADSIYVYENAFYILNDIEKEMISFLSLKKMYQYVIEPHVLDSYRITEASTKIQYLFVLIKSEKYYQASILCHELLSSELNEKMILLCLIAKLFILNAIESDGFDELASRIINYPHFIEYEDQMLVNNVYHVIGLYQYRKKDYNAAWNCFEKVIENKSFLFPEILLMEHICTLTNKEMMVNLNLSDISHFDKDYIVLYKYFLYKKESKDYECLNHYLIDSCVPLIKDTYPQWMLIDIIRDELRWLSKQNQDTKYLYQFNRLYK